jgi:hypothetical protein
MQINIKNINNQIDTYPSNSQIKTFYINNNKNANIIEISVTKDEANTLLMILKNLNEIALKKIISIDNDSHNYYEQLKKVIISSLIPCEMDDLIIQSLNQPNILMLLRKILKENNHRGLLFNPKYTSRVKLIIKSLKNISNDRESTHKVRYGYGLFGINKIKYNLFNTSKLFNPAATLFFDKIFLITTTPKIATNILKILNILNKQDLDNMRIKKDNYYKSTYHEIDSRTNFKKHFLYSVLSKKSFSQIEYHRNIFADMNSDDQEKYIDLLYKIIDNNKHSGFTKQKYTSRAKLIIESLQNISNGSKIALEYLSPKENIIRYIPVLKSILRKQDLTDEKSLNKIIKEMSQDYSNINKEFKSYQSSYSYHKNFVDNFDCYNYPGDWGGISASGMEYDRSIREMKILALKIAELKITSKTLSYKLNILNNFYEIYSKMDKNTKNIFHKLLINEIPLHKKINTAEFEIPEKFNINNTTKYTTSSGRNNYAVFIENADETAPVINQLGYNYPQI